MSMRILLRAVHLGAHYGGKEFLHDIDFNVPAGQIIGVLGVNGAGKTTLFKESWASYPDQGKCTY
jgi:putative ABC transport protein, ATP-binding component